MFFLILALNLATYGSAVTQAQGEDDINTKVRGEVPRQTDYVDLQERIDELQKQMDGRLREEEDNRMWMDRDINRRLERMVNSIPRIEEQVKKIQDTVYQYKKETCFSGQFRIKTEEANGSDERTVSFPVTFTRRPTVMAALTGTTKSLSVMTFAQRVTTSSADFYTVFKGNLPGDCDAAEVNAWCGLRVTWIACQ